MSLYIYSGGGLVREALFSYLGVWAAVTTSAIGVWEITKHVAGANTTDGDLPA